MKKFGLSAVNQHVVTCVCVDVVVVRSSALLPRGVVGKLLYGVVM